VAPRASATAPAVIAQDHGDLRCAGEARDGYGPEESGQETLRGRPASDITFDSFSSDILVF
jgi:hypothetical protein